MNERSLKYFWDPLEAGKAILSFVEGKTISEFNSDD